MFQSLAKQSAVYAASTIAARGAQLLTFLLLPTIIAAKDFGAIHLIVTIGILASLIVPLEVSQGLARYYAGATPEVRRGYSSTAWWFTLGTVLLALVTGLLFSVALCELALGSLEYLRAFRLGLLFIALNTIFYLLQSQCRWQFDVRGFAFISIAYAVTTLIGAMALGRVLRPAVDGVMLGYVLGAATGVFLGVLRLRAALAGRFNRAKLREMLYFSLPLVPAQLALFTSLYSGRFILNAAASLRDVGLYGYASQIAAMALLPVLGLQAALTPFVMAHHGDARTPPFLARLFELFCGLALLLCLGLGLFSIEVITLIGNPSYLAAAPLVFALSLAAVMGNVYIFAPGFAVAKRTVWQLWISLGSAVVSVVANYILIPRWGIGGAAAATLISAMVFIAAWFIFSQRLYAIPVRWIPLAVASVGATALAVTGVLLWPGHSLSELGGRAGMFTAFLGLLLCSRLIPFNAFLQLLSTAKASAPPLPD